MSSSSASGASSSATPNRLAAEKSPYLRQHQLNPVQWFPWGEEAFAKARAEQKPIFLSIGYSTCHWCHVMAHESFENADIAAQMNDLYVCVKVDREERPDVDRLYMTYVQAATGHGGWPMSVWLTPELKPFFGGTYFPPEDRWGRPGFPTILARISDAWKTQRDSIEQEGDNVIASLREHGAGPKDGAVAAGELGWEPLENGFAQLRTSFDERWGGFGGAPKFPRPVNLNFLFRVIARRSEERPGELTEVGAEALRLAELTLRRMAEGGLRDHLGGGFHRYSVDGEWCVPHFEKMLYDQAQLVPAYLEAKQATGREVYAWIAREILAYVQRDLAAPDGGFYSAEDADSTRPDNPAEHGEGAFYVWTKAEVEKLAGADADLARTHYGLRDEGNAPAGADPHGEFKDLNILHQRQPLARTAQLVGLAVEAAEEKLLALNARLFAVRSRRPRPHRDEKILTAWNGLMLSAFARAAQVDPASPTALATAEHTAEFLQRELYDPTTRRLFRSWCEGRSAIPGFAEDYAYLIAGLLDLYEAGGAIRWLQWATELQATMDELFWDADGAGYFGSPAGDASILVRLKEDYDGAEPSPNSVASQNCLRLGAMLARDDWRRRGEATIQAFRARWSQAPHALPQMLVAMDFALGPVRQIVLAGDPRDPAMAKLVAAIHARVEAPRVILWADGGVGQQWLGERAAFFREVRPLDGKPTAYVCRNFTCQLPTTDAAALLEQLG